MDSETKEDPLLKNVVLKPQLLSKFSKEETIKLWTLYFKDPVIVAVRNYILKHALSSEINIELDEMTYNYDLKVNSFKHWTPFLIGAFDWLNVFGMVPWVMTESNGIQKPEIPEIGTGDLAILFDDKEMRSYPVWIENEFEIRKSDTFKSLFNKIMKTNYRVTEGQNKKHTASIMSYQSTMALLIQDYYDFQEIKENLMVADFNSSHPVMFVSKDQVKPAWKEITDEQIFNPYQKNTLDIITEEYNKHFYQSIEELVRNANVPLGIQELGRVELNEGKGSVLRNRRFYDLKPLPSGSKIDRQGLHTAVINYWEAIKNYQMKVTSLFSVSWLHLFGGIDILHKKSSIATTNLSELRSTIINVRREMDELVKDIYRKVYSEVDFLKTKVNVMKLTEMEKDRIEDSEGNKFLKGLTSKNLFELGIPKLVFESNSFIDNVNVQEILMMYTSGILTNEETRGLFIEKLNIKLDTREDEENLNVDEGKEFVKKSKIEGGTPGLSVNPPGPPSIGGVNIVKDKQKEEEKKEKEKEKKEKKEEKKEDKKEQDKDKEKKKDDKDKKKKDKDKKK